MAARLSGAAPFSCLDLINPQISNNNFEVDFESEFGKVYQAYVSTNRVDWTSHGDSIDGSGTVETVSHSAVAGDKLFFRVVEHDLQAGLYPVHSRSVQGTVIENLKSRQSPKRKGFQRKNRLNIRAKLTTFPPASKLDRLGRL